jgi:hypothetical protein
MSAKRRPGHPRLAPLPTLDHEHEPLQQLNQSAANGRRGPGRPRNLPLEQEQVIIVLAPAITGTNTRSSVSLCA